MGQMNSISSIHFLLKIISPDSTPQAKWKSVFTRSSIVGGTMKPIDRIASIVHKMMYQKSILNVLIPDSLCLKLQVLSFNVPCDK